MTVRDALEKLEEIERHLEEHPDRTDPEFYNSALITVSKEEFQELLKEVAEEAEGWEYNFEDSAIIYELGGVTAFVCCTTKERTVEISDEGVQVITRYEPYSIAFETKAAEFLVEVEE